MRTKKCKRCGGLFDTDKTGAYLCPACSLQAKLDSVCRERTCIDCGATFMGYPKSKRCPDCQAAVNRERERMHKRTGPKRPLGSTDHCEACGAEYVVESGRQRYCKKCARSETANNIRAAKRVYQAEYLTPERLEQKAENRSYNKVCPVCGNVFDTGRPDVYCSDECRKSVLRQLDRSAPSHQPEARKAALKAKLDAMSEDELRAYRDAVNARARENYAKRKAKKAAEIGEKNHNT